MKAVYEIVQQMKIDFKSSHNFLISDVMRIVFYLIFCALFLFIATLCLKWCSLSGYQFTLDRVVSVCLYFALICMTAKELERHFGEQNIEKIIFLGSLSINLLIIFLMGQNTCQIYDYQESFLISFQSFGDFSEKNVIFPNWAMYPIVLKLFHTIFGANELTGITLNAVLISASAAMMFNLAKHFLSPKTAILASLIFAAWPSFLEYQIVLSPEFLFVFLLCLSGNFAYRAYISRNLRSQCLFAGLSAATMAFSNYFKAVIPVVLMYPPNNWCLT